MNAMLPKPHKARTFVLFLSISIILIPASSVSSAQEHKEVLGKLKIEGSHIERLVLQSRDGQTKSFNSPDEVINLPTGEHCLQQVHLKGGYSCDVRIPLSGDNWIEVDENKPAILKVGAPLEQKIEVKRHWKFLLLDYKLLDIGGNLYQIPRGSNTQPSFTVYKGDKVVGSGKFAYG